MTFCEGLILNIIFLLFPFFFYILFTYYDKNIIKQDYSGLLDFVNITSTYLIIIYSKYFNTLTFLLLINIPFIISMYKRRKIASCILALSISMFYFINYNLPVYLIVIEYGLYIVLFLFILKPKKSYDYVLNLFTFIKGIVLSIEIIYLIPNANDDVNVLIMKIFIMLVVFYLVAILVMKLIKKAESIMSFNSLLKDLEKEKLLKNSLFKITHEIKNPIAVCKGYLSMMDYNDIDKVKKYNDVIKNEIERTLDIMDDFSDYTKINVNPDIMDLSMLLEDTLYSMKPLFKKNGIVLNNRVVVLDEVIIYGDYNRLKQVIVNVLKNSIEAIDNNGIIDVVLKYKGKNNVNLIISDNGCGMDEDTLNKSGELFYTTKLKGTGLGVSLSKEIIKQHNGSMKYDSSKGKGTKVIITLPKYKNE